MKRFLIGLIVIGLTLGIGFSVYADTVSETNDTANTVAPETPGQPAETPQYQGVISGLIGDQNSFTGNYGWNDQLDLETAFKDDRLKAGLH